MQGNEHQCAQLTILLLGQQTASSLFDYFDCFEKKMVKSASTDRLLYQPLFKYIHLEQLDDESIRLDHLADIEDAHILICLNEKNSEISSGHYQALDTAISKNQGINLSFNAQGSIDNRFIGRVQYTYDDAFQDGINFLTPIFHSLIFKDLMCVDYADVHVSLYANLPSTVQFKRFHYDLGQQGIFQLKAEFETYFAATKHLSISSLLIIIHNEYCLETIGLISDCLDQACLKETLMIMTLANLGLGYTHANQSQVSIYSLITDQ